ncbi:hypothetical protein V1477_017097 [Vespula maculifrons]|uniref:Uncharacterized protein n=1 Tax=Vespula maculifrons TaxID=7453 RepID=A0ABD2B564_VESMC
MLLIMQRTSKHSVQIKTESSSSSFWSRMPILGQDAHPASIKEDFKISLQPCEAMNKSSVVSLK